MSASILERLEAGPVLGDGGYMLELERRCLAQAGPFTPETALEHPDAVRELHREFLRAGAEVLQVVAFYGSREKLKTVGRADKVEELNRRATRLAKEVAGEDALVAADLSPTWRWTESPELARALFDEQIGWQVDEGADFIIGETFFRLGEARACLASAKALSELPVMITMAFRGEPVSDDGVEMKECMKTLASEGADIVGINCMRDPARMLPLIEAVRKSVEGFIAAQPVAFRCSDEKPWFSATPAFPRELDPLQLTRYEMGAFAKKAKELGVDYIGSCCGSVGVHVREMARALGKIPDHESVWQPDYDKPMSETELRRARER